MFLFIFVVCVNRVVLNILWVLVMGSFVFLYMNLRVRFFIYVFEGEVFYDFWMLFDLCFEFLECDDFIIVVVCGIK